MKLFKIFFILWFLLILFAYSYKPYKEKITLPINIKNMKPGDKVIEKINLSNEYTFLNYDIKFKFISGDIELYNALEFILKKNGSIIDEGSFKQFERTDGSFVLDENDILYFILKFPDECNSDLADKNVVFEVIIYINNNEIEVLNVFKNDIFIISSITFLGIFKIVLNLKYNRIKNS